MLEDEYLTRILASDAEPQAWVDRMVNEANRRGGLDNITAIVVQVTAAEGNGTEGTTAETPAVR
jgi:protein phosphatase